MGEPIQQNQKPTESLWQFYLVIGVIGLGVLVVILKSIGLF
ncbi:MAG: hypothetical protein HW412_562 [Bacteroidetes bacterium]|nr:hypothetical protein [Bacteroidota bacterium]